VTEGDKIQAERIQALAGFGYSEREAAFLCIAALHGGFFLRRQYSRFVGTNPGGADAILIEKLLARGHGGALLGCQKAVVYHISARPFYNAIGQENNRNRRMRSADSIKSRLMGIDYVLEHSGPFLATEQEKIDYFQGTLGIDKAELPQKVFQSPNAKAATSRYFMDKFPIYLSKSEGSPAPVTFAYVDEGSATLSRFEAYLAQYHGIFKRLPAFVLDYVTASRRLLWEAERRFNSFASCAPAENPAKLSNGDLARLLAFFRDRQEYESGPGPAFDRARLIRYRDDRLQFAGTFFDTLYKQWKAGGDEAVRAARGAEISSGRPLKGVFNTYLLKHNYDLFGVITNAKEASPWADED